MSKWRVQFITIFSGLLSLLCLAGFGWAVIDYSSKSDSNITVPSAQPIEKRTDEFTLVALGDSLTRGTGDETGKGYVGTVAEELEKKFDQKINVQNLGIKGLVSDQLVEQIKEQEVRRQIGAADAILMTIGGNDLFQQGGTLFNLNQETISEIKTNYIMNVDEIFQEIRQINASAPLFIVGLYNPFIEVDENGEMNAIVRQWNYDTAEAMASYENSVFVPTFDLFQLSVNDYLYSDKFHPNSAGYRLMAERIAALINLEARENE